MLSFGDLPYEIRLLIFKMARKEAFKQRCLRFEQRNFLHIQKKMRKSKRDQKYYFHKSTRLRYEICYNPDRNILCHYMRKKPYGFWYFTF